MLASFVLRSHRGLLGVLIALLFVSTGCTDNTTSPEPEASATAAAAEAAVRLREAAVTAREADVAAREAAVAAQETAVAAEDSAELAPSDGPAVENPLLGCASDNDYNGCILRNLRDPRTPREFAAVIEANRATSQRQRACSLMRDLVSHHPSSREARLYGQYLERQCD